MSTPSRETTAVGGKTAFGLIVQSGTFDRVHYALAMASAALATGRPAILFFTEGACRALVASDADGYPGWAHMPLSPGQTGGSGANGAAFDAHLSARGCANFDDLIDACRDLGARFMVCEMGLKALDLDRDRLRDDITIEEGGLVGFYTVVGETGRIVVV